MAIGGTIGLFVAYARRTADEVSMRVVDAILAVPAILALLMVVTVFGSSVLVLVLAVIVIFAPAVVRVVRAAARQVVPLDFVTAAEARGEGRISVVLREIRPSIHDVLLVEFAIRASWAALVISALSFLGFGVSPPTADWGLMVAENRTLLSIAPWVSIAPVIALSTLHRRLEPGGGRTREGVRTGAGEQRPDVSGACRLVLRTTRLRGGASP